MRKAHTQKNTLLKNAQANAESNFFKRVFFSPTQEEFFSTLPFLKHLFSPTHRFTANTNSCASNVNRFEQSVCGLQTTRLRTDSRAADNIRLKEINFLGALFGNRSVCFLFTFVVNESVSHLIPQKIYFFNPFFVSTHFLTTSQI